ncbi:hypothetical protein G6O69_02200 [Pseudenhygromyxa sp. WMMC2535]|uniref:hypothetical protein n=1 Tax=Pseudenhygromyxa sp. WMMC2535 TaxID=2712867 RepID=UPI00155445CD|nr:hypothetical protein [Pseudenhygromyxa sp. WMMC2535]NVB36627.1 hypothetical protein [Pseudenhygromyxa sp. WMMC2535]
MSFRARIIDRPEGKDTPTTWTICVPGELIGVELEWSCPRKVLGGRSRKAKHPRGAENMRREGDSPRVIIRHDYPYRRTPFDMKLPDEVELDHEDEDEDEDEDGYATWRKLIEIPAPRIWPARIALTLHAPHGPPLQAAIRLIPRASMIYSLLILGVALVIVLLAGGVLLPALRISVQDGLLSLGGVSLFSGAVALFQRIARRSWPNLLPYIGIPYLIQRALLTSLLLLGALTLVSRSTLTTVNNGTKAEIVLALTDKATTESLLPKNSLILAESPQEFGEHLDNYLSKEVADRFCPVWVEEGQGKPEPLLDCTPQSEAEIYDGLGFGPFTPPLVQLRCRDRDWVGLKEDQFIDPSSDIFDLGASGRKVGGRRVAHLRPDDKCELRSEVIASMYLSSFESLQSSGLEGLYQASYPWVPSDDGGLVQLAVDVRHDPEFQRLRVGAKRESGKPVAPGTLLIAQLGVRGASSGRRAVPVPGESLTETLEISIGAGTAEVLDFSPDSTLTCHRPVPSRDSHFRAIALRVEGHVELLHGVEASASFPLSWNSTWERTEDSGARDVWLCAVSAGSGREAVQNDRPFGLEKLELDLELEHLAEFDALTLRVPPQWMSKSITIFDGGDLLGTLSCAANTKDATEPILVTALWPYGEDNRPFSEGIRRLKIAPQNDQIKTWRSVWMAKGEGHHGLPPVFACWPESYSEQAALGMKANIAAALVDGADRTGKLVLEKSQLMISSRSKRRCWHDRSSRSGSPLRNKPMNCSDPRPAKTFELREFRDTRGNECEELWICDADGNHD